MNSLFDTRGSSLLAHRCEACNEELDPESLNPVCEDCQVYATDEEE